MKKIWQLTCLILFPVLMNQAQPVPEMAKSKSKGKGILSGMVYDKLTLRPVEYANAVLCHTADSSMVNGAVADSNGMFRITGIPAGDYYMSVSFIGYQKKVVQKIRLTDEKKEIHVDTVFLQEATNNLKEVNIVSDRNLVDFKIDKKVVNASQQLNAQAGTAADLLKNVPSVTVDAQGTVSIRGSSNFRLLVDGRPSPVQGSDGLQQIPASSVENVEIITSPSAKYDPDGTAGIINVIMKKEKKKGINGVINASAGLRNKYTGDALINFKQKKTSFFLGADVINRTFHPYSLYNREYYLQDTTRYLTNETFRKSHQQNYTIRTGMDFAPDQNNTLSVAADFNLAFFNRNFSIHNSEWYEPAYLKNYYLTTDNLNVAGNYINANLSYQHKFPQQGHTLDAFLTANNTHNDFSESFENYLATPSFDPEGNPFSRRINTANRRTYGQFKLDYVKPFKEAYKLEAGYQADLTFKNIDYRNDFYDTITRQWIQDSTLSNRYDFHQNIQSVYLTFSGSLWGFEYQLGLRAEYYERNLTQLSSGKDYPMDLVNLFPSFHLSRSLPADQEIQLGYSRRVNRPDDRFLNPFPFYSDEFTVQIGNPYLKPEFIDSYEFNYQKKFKFATLSAGNYYRQTNQGIYQVMTIGPDGRLWLYNDNMSKDYAIGLEISANITLTRWWKLSPGIDVSNYTQKAVIEGKDLSSNNNLFNGTLTTTFTIKENTKIQLSGNYSAPMKLVEGDFNAIWGVSISARQDFLKKKLSLTLAVNDIFKSQTYVFDNHKPTFRVYGGFYPEAPTAMLSLSYRFNEFKGRRKSQGPDTNFESGF